MSLLRLGLVRLFGQKLVSPFDGDSGTAQEQAPFPLGGASPQGPNSNQSGPRNYHSKAVRQLVARLEQLAPTVSKRARGSRLRCRDFLSMFTNLIQTSPPPPAYGVECNLKATFEFCTLICHNCLSHWRFPCVQVIRNGKSPRLY